MPQAPAAANVTDLRVDWLLGWGGWAGLGWAGLVQAERRVTSEDEHQWWCWVWVGHCTAPRCAHCAQPLVSQCPAACPPVKAPGPGQQDEEPGHSLDIGAVVLPLVQGRRGQRQSQGK